MTLTFGSLFAGVGGFDLGFEAAGYECRFQVEWDKNCQQTLAYHWPDVPRWGDVSEVNGADLPPVDVITYGFPCQDLSVAGLRAGLDGDRSNLFFQAVRIIKEMRKATNGRYPTWAVAENVPGLLNADGGSAMARVLDALAEAGAMVIEWCVLDAQWLGVPQRRRRVFIASCFDPSTADRCPDPLFPVAPSGARNPAARDQQGKEFAGAVGTGVESGSGPADTDRMTFVPEITTAVCAKWAKGSSGPSGDETKNMVAFVKARRAQNPDDYETWVSDAPNPTLNEFDGGDTRTTTAIVQPTVFHLWQDPINSTVVSPSVTIGGQSGTSPLGVMQPTYSFDTQFGSNANVFDDLSPTLKASQTSPSITQPVAIDTYNQTTDTEIFHTLRNHRADVQPHVIQPDLAVRRLTPLECERLMGWPDNHTLHRADGKTNSDSTRYKQCGNGVAAPVAAWIAKHLKNTL